MARRAKTKVPTRTRSALYAEIHPELKRRIDARAKAEGRRMHTIVERELAKVFWPESPLAKLPDDVAPGVDR